MSEWGLLKTFLKRSQRGEISARCIPKHLTHQWAKLFWAHLNTRIFPMNEHLNIYFKDEIGRRYTPKWRRGGSNIDLSKGFYEAFKCLCGCMNEHHFKQMKLFPFHLWVAETQCSCLRITTEGWVTNNGITERFRPFDPAFWERMSPKPPEER